MSKIKYFSNDMPRRKFLKDSIKGGAVIAATPAVLMNMLSCKSTTRPPDAGLGKSELNRILQKALEKGGDFSDIYIESRITRTITMEESKFKSAEFGISQGAGIRVISGDKTGYAYTENINETNLLKAAETASYVAAQGAKIQPVDIERESRPSFISVDVPLGDVADEKRLDVMRRADQAALEYDTRIQMTQISYYDEVRERIIANSEGIWLEDQLPLMFFIVQTLASGNNNRHLGRERLSKHMGFEMFDIYPPEEVALRAARESVDMLDAQDCPAGRMDVVMENGWGGVLVHEAVGHPLEADNIAKEIGVFTGKLGQKVASDMFTMADDGTLPNMRGTTNFDDEGTPMQKNILIKDGVLQKYMTDILSAKQINMERTGNGRRESFRHIPIPRMTNTFIAEGRSKPEDILSSTQNGLFVQSLSGGSVNPTTGVFNFTCREAYLIENGKKTVPVKGATLIGNCLDIISNIDAVGNNLAFGPGICGKGQSCEVSAGQPTVRIRGINVGGSRARS
jgi:TldD protein